MILAIVEQQEGQLKSVSWETVAGAQRLAALAGGMPITVAVIGASGAEAAAAVARAAVEAVVVIDAPALRAYTADGFVSALESVIAQVAPAYVVLPHTYQTRDFAPKLAARIDRPLVPDCIGVKRIDDALAFTRLMFQGKLAADVVPEGQAPAFVTFQIGAFRADAVAFGQSAAPVTTLTVRVDEDAIRQRPEAPFCEARQSVDLSRADRIVAVGRGLKTKEQLPLAERLAALLDAEIGASRPICDAGWLPLDRQIGSSGQTVAPKLYIALGISGAIQHAVGIKGARTIVAINKDADAPIFEVADYGIVGDLFEIVPALAAELQK